MMYIVFNIDLNMTAAQPPVSFKVPARGQPARRLACCLFAAAVSPWQSCMGEGFSIKSKGATVCARKACLVTVQLCALSFFRSNRIIFWSLNPGAGLFARHAHAFGAAVDAPINRFWPFFFRSMPPKGVLYTASNIPCQSKPRMLSSMVIQWPIWAQVAENNQTRVFKPVPVDRQRLPICRVTQIYLPVQNLQHAVIHKFPVRVEKHNVPHVGHYPVPGHTFPPIWRQLRKCRQ